MKMTYKTLFGSLCLREAEWFKYYLEQNLFTPKIYMVGDDLLCIEVDLTPAEAKKVSRYYDYYINRNTCINKPA